MISKSKKFVSRTISPFAKGRHSSAVSLTDARASTTVHANRNNIKNLLGSTVNSFNKQGYKQATEDGKATSDPDRFAGVGFASKSRPFNKSMLHGQVIKPTAIRSNPSLESIPIYLWTSERALESTSNRGRQITFPLKSCQGTPTAQFLLHGYDPTKDKRPVRFWDLREAMEPEHQYWLNRPVGVKFADRSRYAALLSELVAFSRRSDL
ncbi:hypothetical protein BDQ17DRAFT_1432028 [Cyathus striatus]|nr:hypothetical protein BDQ17DRAFT_1432028 [Cyathus striatus]